MLRFALGLLGLMLGFGLGRGCMIHSPPVAALRMILLVVWPVFCGAGLIAGANLGSYLDRLPSVRLLHSGTAIHRHWLIRGLGLVHCGIAMAIVVIVDWAFSTAEMTRPLLDLSASWYFLMLVTTDWFASVLVATITWCSLLKGWFEFLTGFELREWSSFWRSLTFRGKLAWGTVYYGCGALLLLVPALPLIRLVVAHFWEAMPSQ